MSSSDRLLLILHVGFAIFALGPLTAATMATPRYIRHRNVAVLRYLNRVTLIYGLLSLGIFLFGALLADGEFAEFWLSASMTLFVVAMVLLLIVERDQRKAVHLIEAAGGTGAAVAAGKAAAGKAAEKAAEKEKDKKDKEKDAGADSEAEAEAEGAAAKEIPGDVAQVERGRIAAFSGVIALIWIVILVLMVWNA